MHEKELSINMWKYMEPVAFGLVITGSIIALWSISQHHSQSVFSVMLVVMMSLFGSIIELLATGNKLCWIFGPFK